MKNALGTDLKLARFCLLRKENHRLHAVWTLVFYVENRRKEKEEKGL